MPGDPGKIERLDQEFLRALINHLPLMVFVASAEGGRVVLWNRMCENHFGIPEARALGAPFMDLLPRDRGQLLLAASQDAFETGVTQDFQELSDNLLRDQSFHTLVVPVLDGQKNPRYFMAITEDISGRKKAEGEKMLLENQLRQVQKMESIGRLAGGVAHDFNNLLSIIFGYTDLAMAQASGDGKLSEQLSKIKIAADRARDVTQQLLTFSRKQVLETKVVNLNPLITQFEKLLRPLLRENIEINVLLDPVLGNIRADVSHIQQVLMNLAVNAQDAMPGGGHLLLQTENVEIDESWSRFNPELMPGHYCALAVSDTGQGMTHETQRHLFEPFFTTKPPGHGTGLGLATVYGIVKQHGGHITVQSGLGLGSVFRILLPRLESEAETLGTSVENPDDFRGTETILVAEDEEALRNLIKEVLEARGYTVIAAVSAQFALEKARQARRPIDLLLTDVVMPDIDGMDLHRQIREISPGVKVLFISGYTGNITDRFGVLEKGPRYLPKPFTTATLAQKVREALRAE